MLDETGLPTLAEARLVVHLHRTTENASHADLARLGEEFLTDADDFADDQTRQLLADAIYGEATLRGLA